MIILSSHKSSEGGQATVEFALTLPFLLLFSLCIVQVGSVANDQLALNHAAQIAARAISLADITEESAQQVAVTTIEREITLRPIQIGATLDHDSAHVKLTYERDLTLPVIDRLLRRFLMYATATMPRQITRSN